MVVRIPVNSFRPPKFLYYRYIREYGRRKLDQEWMARRRRGSSGEEGIQRERERERKKEREYMHVRFAQHPHIGLYLIVFMEFLRGCSREENESWGSPSLSFK